MAIVSARRIACYGRNIRAHVRDAGDFALRRAGKFRPDAQTIPHAAGRSRKRHALVDWLAKRAPQSVEMEDFCHSFEHTVELQLIFLQHALGPDVRILPILCGPFARSIYGAANPKTTTR